MASYAGEKAGGTITELRAQVQKLADEMVARGEITTDEARRLVEEMMKQAQQSPTSDVTDQKTPPSEPRRIEIIEEDEEPTTVKVTPPTEDVDKLRDQVKQMQEELRKLQRDK